MESPFTEKILDLTEWISSKPSDAQLESDAEDIGYIEISNTITSNQLLMVNL